MFLPPDQLHSADGTRLAFYRSPTKESAKGNLLLVHGFADHMGRYGHVAEHFSDAGWQVFGVDLRGHGRSEGRRGHVERWSQYVDDLHTAVTAVGETPIVVAHSAGGLVVLDYLRQNPLRGIVLSAPLLHPRVKAPFWKLAAAKALNHILPKLQMGNELKSTEVSRHPDVIRAYETDPLVFHVITPRWFSEMHKAAERVQSHGSRYNTCAYIGYGTAERIVDPNQIDILCAEWGGPMVKQVFAGLYHELFNEPERKEVLESVTTWLEQQRFYGSFPK